MKILIGYINSGSLEAEVLPEEYAGVCTNNDPHSGKKRVKTIYNISVLSNEELYIVCEARDEDKPVEAKGSDDCSGFDGCEARDEDKPVEAKESLPTVSPQWEANLPDFLSVKVRS